MVDNLNLTTLISQIPEAQKIHQPQLASPEAQQMLAQEMVRKRRKQEQKQVLQTDASTAENGVDPEGHQDPRHDQPGSRRKHKANDELDSDQGRLIDMQV